MTAVRGQVALVTGGASGIGLGIARALRESGAEVIIADIDRDSVSAVADAEGFRGYVCDVADADDVASVAARVRAEFGRLGILVNNAGVGSGAPLASMELADWRWMLGINLFGVIHGVSAFLPLLEENTAGAHVVNTASMAAFAPSPGLGAYAASKAGVLALSEVLADELAAAGSSVSVTVLAPGPTRTRIGKSQRSRQDRGALADVDIEELGFDWIRWIEPSDVGDMVVDGILHNERYIFTHPELGARIEARHERIRRAYTERGEAQ